MPLPDVAFESGLGVELELVDVDALPEQLHQRFDQSRMARHDLKHLVELVSGKSCPRRAGFLAPDFLAVELEDVVRLCAQQRDLIL